jgi:ribonuclease G
LLKANIETTPDTILVNRSPGETRAVLMAGGEVVEIAHSRDTDMQSGAVYLGRVGARVPGVGAVFVDIGAGEPGVLALKPPFPHEGAAQAVVVVVPPRANKGCALKAALDVEISSLAKAPTLIQRAPHTAQSWWTLYGASIKHIYCEPLTEGTRVKELLGADAPIEYPMPGENLFALHNVDDAIEAALDPIVRLPCGGSLIMESTSAVIAIDVNSGSSDPKTANGEAMAVVARELRRRNIGGHIVIDVIPCKGNGALPRLLTKAVTHDSVPSRVAGFTPLGMIELTRQRVGLSLGETLLDVSGQLSAKSVGLGALRDAVREATVRQTANIGLSVAPDVHSSLLGDLQPALIEARDAIKGDVKLACRADFVRSRVDVHAA